MICFGVVKGITKLTIRKFCGVCQTYVTKALSRKFITAVSVTFRSLGDTLGLTFLTSLPNDVWQTQGHFPQQSSQVGGLGQPTPARFSQGYNTRQSNIWQSDRPVSSYTTISTYSPANRSSANDSNHFPRYSISPNQFAPNQFAPNQNSIYYGNSSFAEQGGYNVR